VNREEYLELANSSSTEEQRHKARTMQLDEETARNYHFHLELCKRQDNNWTFEKELGAMSRYFQFGLKNPTQEMLAGRNLMKCTLFMISYSGYLYAE